MVGATDMTTRKTNEVFVRDLASTSADAPESEWITKLKRELMMSKMTHNFTFSRNEVMEMLGGKFALLGLIAAPIAPTQTSVGDSDQEALDAIVEYYKSSEAAREILRAWYRTESLAAPPRHEHYTCMFCGKE